MMTKRTRTIMPLVAATAVIAILASTAHAAAPPVQLTLTSQFGREVNLTEAGNGLELEDICTTASKDTCKQGTVSAIPGGFWNVESAAGAPDGNVYVIDKGNDRVQELTSSGQFVAMFGWDVNKTKVEEGIATQQEINVCTETEIKAGGECQAGVEGSAPGQFFAPQSIAVDPNGDVYVAEIVFGEGELGQRVQVFTPEGRFVFEIGKDVNETKEDNLCSHEEEVKEAVRCTGPALRGFDAPYTLEASSFNFAQGSGNVLAINSSDTLYVGEEGRAQEFKADGEYIGEIPTEAGAPIAGLAVDGAGDLYYANTNSAGTVHELNANGESVQSFTVSQEEAGAGEVRIVGFALDSEGHFAVVAEQGNQTVFGSLYEASTGQLLSRFRIPSNGAKGIGFNDVGELFVATSTGEKVLAYTPERIADLVTGAATCVPGPESETDASEDCTLSGEVDPEDVSETQAWFDWGLSEALGEQTPKQAVAATEGVDSVISVRPNATVYYHSTGEDLNVKAPEQLTGEPKSVTTALVAPNIVGAPSALFIKPSSVVMSGELNPENASTEYFYEYAPGREALAQCPGVRSANCPGVQVTQVRRSAVYGKIAAALETTGLQPATLYSFRLVAESENAAKTKRFTVTGPSASFTTAALPTPNATTGDYNAVSATSAIINATVEPDGAPVTYAFELGVYEGGTTQYGVVSSGTVEAGSAPTMETLALTGLQPGTKYAYRVSITSGYIPGATHILLGEAETFTTNGLPAVLQAPVELAQLGTPSIAIPRAVSTPKKKKTASKTSKKKKRKGKKKAKKARRDSPRR